ncbi:MAG: FAD-dependent oxidoreductase [Verrucomicrobiota bacterium]
MKSRRRFMLVSTAAAASPLIARAAPNRADVLVIGAGMAGLAAAQKLRESGRKVIVIEGRHRIGGRIHTSRKWQEFPIDLGASWIHGIRRNPITTLARKAGSKWVETDYDNYHMIHEDGRALEKKELVQLRSIESSIYRTVRSNQTSKRSLADVLRSKLENFDSPNAQFMVNGLIEQEYAADANEISALGAYYGEEFGGTDVWFPNGYHQVFSPMVEGLDLRLGHVVRQISHDQSGVRVSTSKGDFSAARAVVTIPLGVLKRGQIRFSPALPQNKLRAIQSLGMGLLNKVVLRFPKAFWPKAPELFGRLSAEKGHWALWLNLHHHLNEPILIGFNAATFAKATEGWSDQKIVGSAMAALGGMFGTTVQPSGFQITRWRSDPFSLGSYSFLPPGADQRTIRALGEPVADRLFFAGEATSEDYPSTVHGAYLSGMREAGRIMR